MSFARKISLFSVEDLSKLFITQNRKKNIKNEQ